MINRAILAGGLSAAVLLSTALRVHGSFAWLVAAPFIVLRRHDLRPRQAATFGAIFGIATGLIAYAGWLAETGARYFSAPGALAWASTVMLVVPIGAVHGALLGCGIYLALRRESAAGVLAAGAVWAVWDWSTLHLFPYYPWASLAAAQVDMAVALSSVASLGQTGLTAATAAGGLALAAAAIDGRRRHRWVLLAVGAAACVAVAGLPGRTPVTAPPRCSVETIDARLEAPPTSLDPHLAASRTRASGWLTPPSALVWPESSLPASPESDTRLRSELARLAGDSGAILIAGGPRTVWDGAWRAHGRNAAFRVDASGRLDVYDKRWLVPFAEYWPLAPLPVPAWLETDFVSPGGEPLLFTAGSCRLGVLLCFEAQRPELARELALLGADALLVLSNDAQLPASAQRMEIAQARLRAAETGLPVIRAANHGESLWILGSGVVVAKGDGFRAEIAAPTPAKAVTLGPIWLAVCIAGGAMQIYSALRSGRRRG